MGMAGKKQRILFILISAAALTVFYFAAKNYCDAGLICATSYCEKTRNEVVRNCAVKGMIIFSVPIVLVAGAISAGIMFVTDKIIKK